jgi:antitoxin ParD1/3/4/toxin ParE1/3/4
MEPLFEVAFAAQEDLFEIWRRIAQDSVSLADRIETELYEAFESVARMPGIGHTRKDLTRQPVLFFPLYSFLIVYQANTRPVRIMAVLRGKRDLKRLLAERI